MKQLFFLFLFLNFSLSGIQVKDIAFKRVFSGMLKEEEELFVRSFAYAYHDVPENILKGNWKERLRHFFSEEQADLNDPAKEIYIIRAEYKNELIGYVSFELSDFDTVYIRELAIDPSVMGYGLGKRLVFICQEYIPDVKKVSLATTFYNKRAIGFYKHLGFTKSVDVPHGLDPNLFIGLEYSVSE